MSTAFLSPAYWSPPGVFLGEVYSVNANLKYLCFIIKCQEYWNSLRLVRSLFFSWRVESVICSWVHSSFLFPCCLSEASLHYPLDGSHSTPVICFTTLLDKPPPSTSSPPSTDLKKLNSRLQRGMGFLHFWVTGGHASPTACVELLPFLNFEPRQQIMVVDLV